MLAAVLCAPAPTLSAGDVFLQRRGYRHPADLDAWRRQEERGGLERYPDAPPGTRNPPGGLSRFGGSGPSTFGSVELGMPFADWKTRMARQRRLLRDVRRAPHGRADGRPAAPW